MQHFWAAMTRNFKFGINMIYDKQPLPSTIDNFTHVNDIVGSELCDLANKKIWHDISDKMQFITAGKENSKFPYSHIRACIRVENKKIEPHCSRRIKGPKPLDSYC